MAENIQQLLRERLEDDTTALVHGDRSWTWREHLAEASAEAAALVATIDPGRPVHVGTLLDNGPEMLRAMAGAGLAGYVLCGVNTTRRGESLAADVRRADCQVLLTDRAHLPLIEGLDLGGARVVDVDSEEWADEVAAAGPLTPHREVGAMDTLMMIFTAAPAVTRRRCRCRTSCPSSRASTWSAASRSGPTTSATSRCRSSTPTRWRQAGRWH